MTFSKNFLALVADELAAERAGLLREDKT